MLKGLKEDGMHLTREQLMEAVRDLERDGYIHSQLCPDGKVRWFLTGKPMPDDEDGSGLDRDGRN